MPRLASLPQLAVLVAVGAVPARAQTWNSGAALALARRAVARRMLAAGDTTLRDYQARAHGFVFFLGQFGEGVVPPRLIKADQLELQVYWKAPDLSKQRIVGWRDKAELPTDIVYHRDHLGLIQNNFGSGIRLGEGDEVRDVPHPFGADGRALYDYALGDTTTIALPDHVVRVVAVAVRPKDFTAARVVGTLFVDVESGALVRLAFTFTPHAYLDATLDDVTIVLDNALWEGRYWLPYRQEIAIRRHTTWIDLPAWGIIRTRWAVDGYELNPGLAAGLFAGEEIVAAPQAVRDSFPWPEPLAAAIEGVAEPVRQEDLAVVRDAVARVAGEHVLSGLGSRRFAAGGLSDLVHANRVQGLVLGAGVAVRPGEGQDFRLRGAYGFADHSPTAVLDWNLSVGRGALGATLYRTVRDVADAPIIAPLINSFAAQEFGADDGDYYRATGGGLSYRHGLGSRAEWTVGLRREGIDSLAVHAVPSNGSYRSNPAFPPIQTEVVQIGVRRRAAGVTERRDLRAAFTVEAGWFGATAYTRSFATAEVLFPLEGTEGLVRLEAGAASADLPGYRAFVLGGRGTLLGEDFRSWGGRRLALVHAEWRVPVPFAAPLGSSEARAPRSAILAPYVAAGAADDAIAGTPWSATPGPRVSVGAALEWLGVFRLDAAIGVQTHALHLAFDVTEALWGVM